MLSSLKYGVLAGVLWIYLGFGFLFSLWLSFTVYLVAGGWKWWRIAFKTGPRDFRVIIFFLKSLKFMRQFEKNNDNIATLFAKNVEKHPDKAAFIMVGGKEWTFREVDDYSNKFANYLCSLGYKKGDVAALYMGNCPEYVCLWVGMAKIGVTAAFVNYSLREQSLAHCIKSSQAKGVVFGTEAMQAIQDVRPSLPLGLSYYCLGSCDDSDGHVTQLEPILAKSSKEKPPNQHVKMNDRLLLIYTSGTTGLPKAAIIIHSRFFMITYSLGYFPNLTADDIIYNALPLYHTAGGILGVGQALINGCTVVIRKKFSASTFWDECIRYNCTVIQYIGEICRYLLAQPPKPTDRQHKVRCAIGNGLRPQIWSRFIQRFNVKWVEEFYGATESNANSINTDNTFGAVGSLSMIIPGLPIQLVRVDEETGELLRDENGLCIRCGPGEPGEIVGKVIENDPVNQFHGYLDKQATSKKLAKDVLNRGDTCFMTGDILIMDELGYLYFRDRIGDTFRWRGENVSTAEVEATISNITKLTDAVVYGVQVPGTEGRAGMAAIFDDSKSLDLKALHLDLQKVLPSYARPIFIRVSDHIDLTGTFKLRKVDYRKEGFDPSKVKDDSLYYLDNKLGQYQPIDQRIFEDINTGKIRF